MSRLSQLATESRIAASAGARQIELVRELREAGTGSWAEIARATGMTRGAAQSRFSRLIDESPLPKRPGPHPAPARAGIPLPTESADPTIVRGDSLRILREIEDDTFDAIVTDPPYELGFTRISGRKWDATGIAFSTELWTEALRVLKPGGNLLAFGAARTYHRLAVAIEDSGFELRDSILAWVKSSGFAKSQHVDRLLDKRGESALSATWEGVGTGLKPAHEPIIVAREPPEGSIVDNVIAHHIGGLNIDAARIPTTDNRARTPGTSHVGDILNLQRGGAEKSESHPGGRWPTDMLLIHRPGCVPNGPCAPDCAAAELESQSAGSSRFFPAFHYQGRAAASERPKVDGVEHLSVKPLALMEWLVGLATLPGQLILDPFAGSGATIEAAMRCGVRAVGIDHSAEHIRQVEQRIARGTASGLTGRPQV